MKTALSIIAMTTLTISLSAPLFAADSTMTSKQTANHDLHRQIVCPVMGEPIDSSVFSDIQGQRVYYCCKSCASKFKADSDKYFKKAAADGVLFENVQTTCPVTGETLNDKDVYIDFEGRRIYFCCLKCRKTFQENPQKYLSSMDAPAKKEAEVKESLHHKQK